MKAIDRPFTKIINGTMQFVIPVFQRDYSWTESQCEQLWSDILQVAEGESTAGHFLGSVVYVATGDTSAGFTRWLLIDGQQRMSTLALLMAALRDHIEETSAFRDPHLLAERLIRQAWAFSTQEPSDGEASARPGEGSVLA